jgi:hypothetical protein
MKRWMFSGLFLGLTALPSVAQEPPPLPEGSQLPATPPEKLVPPPAPLAEPGCGSDIIECIKHTWNLHWLERQVPGVAIKHELKEHICPDTKPGFELLYNQEQCIRHEMALKPCETVKEVTICTQKPIVTVDPCTGCSTVTFQPVTEVKLVKEITYQLVPEDKVVTVQRPFLKPVEIPIGRKTLTLETTCEPVIRKEIFGVLVPVEIKERKKPCPPVPLPLPTPGCVK